MATGDRTETREDEAVGSELWAWNPGGPHTRAVARTTERTTGLDAYRERAEREARVRSSVQHLVMCAACFAAAPDSPLSEDCTSLGGVH